jgi:hypothetical protein
VCNVRGITLNYSASQLAHFDVMNGMILRGDETEKVTVHTERKIKRKRAVWRIHIVTEPEEKMYRVSFSKRRLLGDNMSVPLDIHKEGGNGL